MKQITIELDDAHYKRSHYKRYYTVEEYAKQQIENITDTFYQRVKDNKESESE